MEFCVGTCAKIDSVGLVKQAEDLGATHFGVGDGPLLFSDPYQYLALAARETSTIELGTWVTNPITRIAPVTANSHATLNALAPGPHVHGHRDGEQRAAFDGCPPGDDQGTRRLGAGVQALMRGERTEFTWRGKTREVEFLDHNGYWYNDSDPIKTWIAAGGPRGLRLAAQTADVISYCLGPKPEMIQLIRREIDKGVADAGRPPGSVKLAGLAWFYQLENGEDWQDAVDNGFGSGPISSCITNSGLMAEHVDELGQPIVDASTKAAMAYLGDPDDPNPPHHLDVWSKYLRGLDPVAPAADHQGARRLLVPLRHPRPAAGEDPADVRERRRHRLGVHLQPVPGRDRHRQHRQLDHRPALIADSTPTAAERRSSDGTRPRRPPPSSRCT